MFPRHRRRARRRPWFYYSTERVGPRVTLRWIGDPPSDWRRGEIRRHGNDFFEVMLVHADGSIGGMFVRLTRIARP